MSYFGDVAFYTFNDIKTQNEGMKKLLEYSKKVSHSRHSVHIEGKTGTGKSMLAEAIHNESHRKNLGFVRIDCADISMDFAKEILFGYKDYKGKLELSRFGTVYFKNIDKLPLDVQDILCDKIDNFDVRVISSSCNHIYDLVSQGKFSKLLYNKFNKAYIKLLDLNERNEDIPLLISYFTEKISEKFKLKKVFTKEAIECFSGNFYERNISELRAAVEDLFLRQEGQVLSFTNTVVSQIEPMDLVEERCIRQAITYFHGDILKAAGALKISRATIYRKLDKYKIKVKNLI